MSVHVFHHRGVQVIRPLSELTAEVADEWRDRLGRHDRAGRIAIDLDGALFIDSSGLGILIGGIRRMRSRGADVALVCSVPQLVRLLHVAGLDRIVPVRDSLDEASAALGGDALVHPSA